MSNTYNDKQMQKLLYYYTKEEFSNDLADNIDHVIDNYYNLQQTKNKIKTKEKLIFFPTFPAISMASVFLVALVFVIILFSSPQKLNENLIITDYSSTINQASIISMNSSINVSKTIKIQTKNALLLLKENSLFVVNNNSSIFKKDDVDVYSIKQGEIYIDIDRPAKYKFELYTDLGKISTEAARFDASYKENTLVLNCFEGSIDFIDINSKKITLDANERLVVENKENNLRIKNENVAENEIPMYKLNREIVSSKVSPNFKKLKVFEIEADNPDANIYLNDSLIGIGRASYLFTNQEKVKIKILLKGFNEINKELIINNSAKEYIKLNQLQMKEENNNQFELPIIKWDKKLGKDAYTGIKILKDYIMVFTKDSIKIIDKEKGLIIKKIKYAETGVLLDYNNYIADFESPDTVNIYKLPEYKSIFSITTGPIAFGSPLLNDNLIVASTDHYLYIYDYKNKTLSDKIMFDFGLYCTPVMIDKDQILLSNFDKKVILYSISTKRNIWEYQFNTNIKSIIVNNDLNTAIITCNELNNYVLNIKTGNLSYEVKAGQSTKMIFVNDNLLVSNSDSIALYNSKGDVFSSIKAPNNVKGLFHAGKYIYIITATNLLYYYNNNLTKAGEVMLKGCCLYNSKNNELYIVSDDSRLIKYELK